MNARDGMKRLRNERRAAGLCTGCGLAPSEEGRTRCRECLDMQKKYNRKWREAHPETRERYEAAMIKRRQLRAERIAAGLCPDCGKNRPHPMRRTCESCLQKRRTSDRRRGFHADAGGTGGGMKEILSREQLEAQEKRRNALLDKLRAENAPEATIREAEKKLKLTRIRLERFK